jgi:hypothetical protein
MISPSSGTISLPRPPAEGPCVCFDHSLCLHVLAHSLYHVRYCEAVEDIIFPAHKLSVMSARLADVPNSIQPTQTWCSSTYTNYQTYSNWQRLNSTAQLAQSSHVLYNATCPFLWPPRFLLLRLSQDPYIQGVPFTAHQASQQRQAVSSV